MKLFFYKCLFLGLILLTGFQSFAGQKGIVEQLSGQSEVQIIKKADTAFLKKEYDNAAKLYEALHIVYPLSADAEDTQFKVLQSYYKAENMPNAVEAAERFMRLYPCSDKLEMAYYLKSLANYYQDRGWLLRRAKVDIAYRDPGTMRQAAKDFTAFLEQFPNSDYAPDIKERLNHLYQQFADYECHIIDFYFRKKAYRAAIDRADALIKGYPETEAAKRALIIQQAAQKRLAEKA